MNLIAAVDKNWGIGYGGSLLISIPQDLKLFREETFGKVVIMGRKTFEDLPGKRALEGRTNIILSKSGNFAPDNAIVLKSVEDCLAYLKKENIADEDVFIIGGESIYEAFLPYCNIAHITYIDYAYRADRHMQNLDETEEWELALETEEETFFDISYSFKMYKRIN